MVWSPLNYARPAWDWLFIIDLTLTSLALVPQLAAWAFRQPDGAAAAPYHFGHCSRLRLSPLQPLVRSLDVPFPTVGAFGASLAFAGFLILPLRRGSGPGPAARSGAASELRWLPAISLRGRHAPHGPATHGRICRRAASAVSKHCRDAAAALGGALGGADQHDRRRLPRASSISSAASR